ncbi:MAG: hypothetical protein D4R64_01750 [Porphyromonadaceae bacterium]|nr:MAG: hypothetical protein D4R64_01750 [Porphyromonadaceae bacterium]
MIVLPLQAQNDLLEMLDQEIKPVRVPVDATFKSTRVINCHSIERMQAGNLEFHVSHRFGLINSGFKKFYGLDESSSYVSLEYGVTNWLEVGLGRATVDESFNGFVKLSPIRQSKGKWAMPVSASLYLATMTTTKDYPDPTWVVDAIHRRSFVAQLLVARKFAPWLSLQVSPTFVHRNMVATSQDPNRIFALGLGGRVKFTRRTALSVEYFWLKDRSLLTGPPRYNPLSIGLDIETGSHVFQIFVTNSFNILEHGFIGETTRSWRKKELHIGFNISRVFTVIKKKT